MTSGRVAWTEGASVAIAVLAASYLFSEIIRTQLPSTIEPSAERVVWLLIASAGPALLCVGVGVILISGFRMIRILRQDDGQLLRAAAKDLLWCAVIVVAGFIFSVCALLTMGVLR